LRLRGPNVLASLLWLVLWWVPTEDEVWRLRGWLVFDGMPMVLIDRVILSGDTVVIGRLSASDGREFIYLNARVRLFYRNANRWWEPARRVRHSLFR
jgi:hypothetical protein